MPLAALLGILLAPAGAAAQLFPSLPFDHKQFELEMIGADQLRLTDTVELVGDGFTFHADQVDIFLEAAEEASADEAGGEPSTASEAVPDGGGPAGDEAAGEEADTPSLRLVASGNVVFSTAEVHLSADRVEYWTIDQTAIFHQAYGWIDLGDEVDRSMFGTQEPDLLFHGQMIERTGPRTYKITKGAFTSCVQPTPRWQMVATSFTLNLDSYALLVNAVLKVKGVPVFYLPGMFYPIQEDGRATGMLMPTYGASRYQGSSLSNAFFWAINRSQDATFYYDRFMQHGGDGRGAEYRYTRGNGSQGNLRMYRLNEPEAEIAYAGGTRTRQPRLSYEYRGQARQGLPADWNARGQIDYFTDIDVRQTYHTNVFDASNSRRSISGNLSGPVGEYELSGTYDYSETFFGTDSALNGAGPRLAFGRGKTELFGAPLYFSFDAEYAKLLRRRGAGAHRHRARERSEDDRRAGTHELRERHPRQRLGEELRAGRGDGHRRHRAGDAERRHHRGLVVPGVDLQRPEHRRVPHQRRVRVDQARDDRVRVHERVAEDDLRHRHGVFGAFRSGDRTHERLVRPAQVAVDHVEVALVDRQVDRLAQRPSRVVQAGREVCKLHEVAEVLDRRVAPAFVEAADERGAVGGREHHVRAADARAALGIAGVLHELGRRGVGHDPSGEAAGDSDPLTVDIGAGFAPQRERFRVAPEFDANLRENRLRVVLDELETLGGHHVVDRHPARDVGHDGRSGLGSRRPARLPAAAPRPDPSAWFTGHSHTSFDPRSPRACSVPIADRAEYRNAAEMRLTLSRPEHAWPRHVLHRGAVQPAPPSPGPGLPATFRDRSVRGCG